jgi:CrcB protein
MGWVAVGIGAACGAWLRWGLGLWLSTSSQSVPWGTLAANWIGGYAIGFLVAFFDSHTQIALEWRLFLITGFLGGLTTFSTFSAEAMGLLQRGDYLWFVGHSALHLIGAIGLCIAGFATYRAVFAG